MVIDTYESRDVTMLDVGGIFLLSKKAEFFMIKFDGKDLETMLEANLSYRKYVTIEHGKRVLYLKLRTTTLYGIIQVALLWYETFVTCLKVNGFKPNKYDPCISNKMVTGKQCVIFWHIDDNKISHENPKVVDSIIKILKNRFGKVMVTRGNKHKFLGMDIEFKKDGTVSLGMIGYLKECIEIFGEDITRKSPTHASSKQFEVSESKDLDKIKSEVFHHIVAQLLYASKRP